LNLKPINSPLKSVPIGCPETFVTNNQPTTRSFSQRRGSLKSDRLERLKNMSVRSCAQWILCVSYGCHNESKVRKIKLHKNKITKKIWIFLKISCLWN
jgi:hypothetical protein